MEVLNSKSYQTSFMVADGTALNAIHLGVLFFIGNNQVNLQHGFGIHLVCSNIFWLIAACLTGIYATYKPSDMKSVLGHLALAFILMIIPEFLISYPRPMPEIVVADLSIFGLFLLASRLLLFIFLLTIDRNEIFKQKVIIIGCNEFSQQLVKQFKKNKLTCLIKGFFDNECKTNQAEYPVLGTLNDCIPYSIENGISEIYSTILPDKNPDISNLAEMAEKNFIRFRFVPDLRQYLNRETHVDFIEDMPVLSLRSEPLAKPTGQLAKRIFDIVLTSLIIVFILSWLAPLIAILIKLDSKGPVFFKQVRTGEKNKPFVCLKFRSLKVNDHAHTKQVTRDDDRFTRVGKFLRKTNLDELPQFFNVLAGQMSIVGSRPHMLKHTEDFSRIYHNYMLRHFIKPGVTGWAQINGYRGEIKMKEQLIKRVEHDIWYIENWSIWLDIRIVFQTFLSVFKNDKNAY